jgi:predicted nucleotidyltransferase
MVTAAPDLVDDVKRLIEAHGGLDGVVAAFVFGSQAWGDAAQGSDIDVMVLLDRRDDPGGRLNR